MRPLLPLLVLLLCGTASAQIRPGDAGFRLVLPAGAVGTTCRGFTCAPYPASMPAGTKATLEVRGQPKGFFAVFLSPNPQTLCAGVPGIFQSLVLAPPLYLFGSGLMTQPDMILSCPGGVGSMTLAIPSGIPAKTQVNLQALVQSFGDAQHPSGLALTAMIALTIT